MQAHLLNEICNVIDVVVDHDPKVFFLIMLLDVFGGVD